MHCVHWRGLGVGRPGSNLRPTKRAGAAGASWRATGLRAASGLACRHGSWVKQCREGPDSGLGTRVWLREEVARCRRKKGSKRALMLLVRIPATLTPYAGCGGPACWS